MINSNVVECVRYHLSFVIVKWKKKIVTRTSKKFTQEPTFQNILFPIHEEKLI